MRKLEIIVASLILLPMGGQRIFSVGKTDRLRVSGFSRLVRPTDYE